MEHLLVLAELQNLLPPLSDEEFAGLEESILKDGCLSPLIVWKGLLIDGHHRYDICRKHNIPFSVKNVVFDDTNSAKLWAWKHQEHRRNLTAYHRAELALKLKDVIAAKAKARQVRKPADSVVETFPQQEEASKTREELAEIAKHCGVSHTIVQTVRRELHRSGPMANTHDDFARRLAGCSRRKQNEFKRNYDVVDLRCEKCSLYQELHGRMLCANTNEPREPNDWVCDYFDYCEPYVPIPCKPKEIQPLADHGEHLMGDPSKKLHRTYGTYERRNVIKLKLPREDPQYFVQVLLMNFRRDYLTTILPVLNQRLLEKDNDDEYETQIHLDR